MTTPVAMQLPMREDVVTDGGKQDQVLANAPKSEEGFFVVPKVEKVASVLNERLAT
jgi:aspartyl-tRNA(Asn)/glutamyl-tRNA(Gln) amidotransferase subunit C